MTLLQRDRGSKVPTDTIGLVDGEVTGVWRTSVDTISMLEAGLTDLDDDRRYVEFGWARDIAPGQYRVTLQINQAAPELERIGSELLVAYVRTPK